MDKFFNSASRLFEAIAKLDTKTLEYLTPIILALILIFCIYKVITNLINSKNQKFYYNKMVKEKNKEIERLADDNRRYREIYLLKVGITKDLYDKISAEEI